MGRRDDTMEQNDRHRTVWLARWSVGRSEHLAGRRWNQSHFCGQQESLAISQRDKDKLAPVRTSHSLDARYERLICPLFYQQRLCWLRNRR